MSDTQSRQEQFLRLFEPLYGRLERFVMVMTRNDDDAKDILSETVLQAYQNFGKLRHEAAFLSFLFTIATRVYRRSLRRDRRQDVFDERFAEQIPDHAMSPERRADIAILHEAIRRLPAKEREAITMHELLGFSIKDIQAVQGGSISGVKVRLMRARRKLASMLDVKSDSNHRLSAAPEVFYGKEICINS